MKSVYFSRCSFWITLLFTALFATVISSAATPELARSKPAEEVILIKEGTSIAFEVNGVDVSGDLRGVTWYTHYGSTINQFVENVGGNGTSATFNKVFTFNNDGDYRIVVQGFDRDGNHSKSVEWSISVVGPDATPVVSRVQPEVSSTISEGSSIRFKAAGLDFNDNLRGVTWYTHYGSTINQFVENVGGTRTSATFDKVFTFNNDGEYRIAAQGFDRNGNHSKSVEWSITVLGPDNAPELSKVQPEISSTIVEGDSIRFKAAGSDFDNNLRGVTWYTHYGSTINQFVENVDGSGASAIFDKVFTFNNDGEYKIAAQAFDRNGNHSKPVEWSITATEYSPIPQLTRVQPLNNTRRVMTGESITFTAEGVDNDSNLRGVTWYPHDGGNSTQLTEHVGGNGSEATFQKTLTFNEEGSYRVAAQVFDSTGNHARPVEWNITVADKRRGMYINKFPDVIADMNETLRVLEFAKAQNFDYFVLYGVLRVFADSDHQKLSNFINLAKQEYGIKEIAIAGAGRFFFEDVEEYNNNYSGKCDVMNIEYEYWNLSDYDGYIQRLTDTRAIADRCGLELEAYIGQFNSPTVSVETQATTIAGLVDRLLVHSYRSTPHMTFDTLRARFDALANTGVPVEIRPLFSAEYPGDDFGSRNFMGDWLADPNNSLEDAEDVFMEFFRAHPEPWINSINITGFQYFTSSLLLDRLGPDAR